MPCLYEITTLPSNNQAYQEVNFESFVERSKTQKSSKDSHSNVPDEPSIASIGGFFRSERKPGNLDSEIANDSSPVNFYKQNPESDSESSPSNNDYEPSSCEECYESVDI